jgi:phage terminase Nu1 subunit (DNA packaging protein)
MVWYSFLVLSNEVYSTILIYFSTNEAFLSKMFLTNILLMVNIYNMGNILLKDIPEDLKRKFKALCATRGKTMKEEILRLMKEEVERKTKDEV